MSSAPTSPAGSTLDPREIDHVLERFEQSWQKGPPPRIEEFLPPATAANRTAWYELLGALIKIDLDRRCRQPGSDPARVESYLQRWPELANFPELVVNLVWAEYESRSLWAQRPAHAEYLSRFPQHQARIVSLLAEADRQLVGELAEAGKSGAACAAADGRAASLTEPAPVTSRATFLEILGQCQFLSAEQWRELTTGDWPRQFTEPRALAAELLKRGWLTPFQANQLFQGRGSELILGPYLLLERLGAGGTGLVFKAMHRKMQRPVALKLIRRELVRDAEVVSRFLRELEVISQLDHPNIVHAYDAGPIGETYFLAMEYVEGVDLDRLVRRSGPLSAPEACDYVRQAALGLQHAHERGLVHRDIKPSNLFLARSKGPGAPAGVVKLLDLGLARFREGTQGPSEAVATRIVTPVGAVLMGTPDYMAPEQANDFHAADIRSDVYGLGCTLFFLLTGRAPFAGVTLAQKLVHHQLVDPPDVRTLRPEVPAGVARALKKMLSKRPQDRYQTPGELAAALPQNTGRTTVGQKLANIMKSNRAASAVGIVAILLLGMTVVFLIRGQLATSRERKDKEELTRKAVPAFVESARRAVERRQVDAALEQADLALRYDPGNADARLLRAEVLTVLKDFAGARAELERYLRQRPGDNDAARLIELCQRPRPEEAGYLLDLAQILERKEVPALADVLLTRHGSHSRRPQKAAGAIPEAHRLGLA
jgi:serine/threonine-protein kinase